MSESALEALLKLPVSERLDLIDRLWESVSEDVELTASQKSELDRRVADFEAHPDDGLPWASTRVATQRRGSGA